jgi:hypothetical protein
MHTKQPPPGGTAPPSQELALNIAGVPRKYVAQAYHHAHVRNNPR